MFLTEYDEKKVLEMEREEGREEGRKEGRKEGREEGREEGRKEGRQEGETRLGSLINVLIRSGRSNDALRASTDDKYRKHLYQELNIQ